MDRSLVSTRKSVMLEGLRNENSKLKEDIVVESKMSTLSLSSTAAGQIAKLQEQADQYTRKIELEKRRVAELDRAINGMQTKIEEQRRRMGGVNAAKDNNQQVQKHIKILENRLDKSLQRYNEAVAHNRSLRLSIDDLRRERLVFEGIYKKLERELVDKKRELVQVTEMAQQAAQARDAAVAELARLKSQAEKEQGAFEAEWRELGRMIENDRRMRDMLKAKRLSKLTAAANTVAVSKPGTAPAEGGAGTATWQDLENKKRANASNQQWSSAKEKGNQSQVSAEKVQSYSDAFTRITEATGIADVDQLVATFVNAEDENYRLFKYVEELNQEIAKLEEQIGDVKAEIERFKGQGANTDSQRKKILRDLEDRLQRTESKAEAYENKHATAMKTVHALKLGIHNIFVKIGCATSANKEMLGEEGVSEANMMQYLGIIEQRTNEILQQFAASQAAMQGQDTMSLQSAVLGQGPAVPAGAATVVIEPPSIPEEEGSDGGGDVSDDERPLTREELQARAEQRLKAGLVYDGGARRPKRALKPVLKPSGPSF